jgi:penicillin G amidase
MKLKRKKITLIVPNGTISIKRNDQGIPEITGSSLQGLAYGMGWLHACDRQMQVLLTRIIMQGRAAEKLAGTPELIEVDRFMRRTNLKSGLDKEASRLKPEIRDQVEAYCDGFNACLADNGPVPEFRLLGYDPEPLSMNDILVMAKVMGFIGLADAQGGMEKFLIQMIQKKIDEKKIRELFPYLSDKIDYRLIGKVKLAAPPVPEAIAWLGKLPRFNASNNWAVSGSKTATGKPIMCSDPHLEINRIPGIWYEAVLRLPDNVIKGASLPGVPGVVLGRSKHLAWGPTFSYMDMIDFRIEECRDGMYRRGNKWLPFRVREETILVKKGKPVIEKIYENEHGTLEGDPNVAGHYLVLSWSADGECGSGDFNGLVPLMRVKSVREAMQSLRLLDAGPWCFALADTQGNIGFQMTGRTFDRPKGVTGLVPTPGWEKKFNPRGFVDKTRLPSLYNPKQGFVATANQDLNHLGRTPVINLCMATYRVDRISQLLSAGKKLTVDDMKRMHYDLYSLQAERYMKVLRPLLPDNPGGRILKEWDCVYDSGSTGAMLFESVYLSLLRVVFGDNGLGRDVIDHIMKETPLFNDYYGNFDEILMKKDSPWFNGKKREDLFEKAIGEGLAARPVPYGKTRSVILSHLLLGGKLPRFLGFDRRIELPGSRATITQGQIFRSAGRVTTYCPSYRMIADMATDELHTCLPGGVSDRRFSPWFLSDLKNWFRGKYKVLR